MLKKINKKNIITKSMLVAVLITNAGPYLNATSIKDMQKDVEQQNQQVAASDKEIKAKQAEISKLNNSVKKLEKELDSQRNEINESQEKLTKIEAKIAKKQEKIAKLQVELDEHKKDSSSFLGALQKNANINYFLQIMSNDSMDTKTKLTSFHGLNILANDSYDMLMQTAKLQNKVESSQEELETEQSNLEDHLTIIASESDELLQKSQEQAKQKEQIMQEVTSMSSANEAQKKQLLASTDLLESYENSGCSGNEVYGVDCGVDESTISTDNIDALPEDLNEITTEEVTTETLKNTKSTKSNKIAKNDKTTNELTSNEKADEEKVIALLSQESTTEQKVAKQNNEVTTKTVEPTTKEVTTEEATTSPETGGSMTYYNKLKADPNANYIIQKESGWNPYAVNASSGAYGLCQALPASKMASAGSDWATNPETQAKWCDAYAIATYGSWANARAFWDSHNWW